MACGCGNRNPRPKWEPRAKRAARDVAAGSGEGRRVITSAERATEAAAATRPRRARQPTG